MDDHILISIHLKFELDNQNYISVNLFNGLIRVICKYETFMSLIVVRKIKTNYLFLL